MNETIINFLNTLNIDYEKFNLLEGSKIKRDLDVNPILSRSTLYKSKTCDKKVSIADVVGYDYRFMSQDRNILKNLSCFFDRDGDNYHSRSVSLLDIPQSQIMNQLSNSFKRDPICLIEVDSGKYNIGNNGLHRFHILKTHYLDELSRLNPKDKVAIKQLNEKYSFVANVLEIDFVKSYSGYLLNLLDSDLKLENHYNSNFEMTDKSCLINYSNPNEKLVLTDNQLIETVKRKMNNFLRNATKKEIKQLAEILNTASSFESFNDYYNFSLNQKQKGE